ncbi:hypothetical protein AC623_16420 [Bacillus sp. FJAT-27231]|uniref:GerAB/ArcD/ProY family transporter n=1 Tax=Bacillus sp. FJAT-27231 TaxID=1679168 RepID=UPI000670C46C|nr:GerAB/ArcD/ProY family transporter [Bacillus sp. FJAT-27231]KMY55325.1 hypothetical protein AC623_16420 [Bacillus sp. FJAT-27231]
MNRYFYYLLAVNMVAHIITFVPMVLFEARKGGAIVSMILSLVLGTIMISWIVKIFTHFPGKGYPELLKEYTSKWISFLLLLSTALVWFTAGLITVITYSALLRRFLTPEMPLMGIISMMVLFVSFGILMNSKSVLYTVEIVALLSIPFTIFIFVKMYLDKGMNWDFVREAMMYIGNMPDYPSFSASLYVILGPANLIIFNRVFTDKQKMTWKEVLIIGMTGAFALFTSYFIPIGFQGFKHINYLIHPWFLTADSIRMKFGFIERVLFIFALVNLAVSFLSILVHWHVTTELLKNIIWFKKFQWKGYNLTPLVFVGLFWIGSLVIIPYLTEPQLYEYTKYALNFLSPYVLVILFSLLWIKKRARA